MAELYFNPNQTRDREPTSLENAIADVIERSYASGIVTCEGLVAELNKAAIAGPDGKAWSEESFKREMALLGA
jgi:hypothetical protein